jgi:type IV secretion system protein VirB10
VDGAHLLLPQGTKVVGTYDSAVVYGQERVLVVWTRLILPNGKSLSLEGMPGIDLSGYAGLSDKVNNHYGKLITGVVLGSILGAGVQMAEGARDTTNPSFSELAAQGAARNINDAGQQITRKNLNIQPTLEISQGHRFSVFVTKDLILEPYE